MKFKMFLGIASFEAKRNAGEKVFESVLFVLPKPLSSADEEQILCFKNHIVPLLSKDEIECLEVYLKRMININRPDGCLTGKEEQHYSKWESIYTLFLDALSQDEND